MRLSLVLTRPVSSGVDCFDSSRVVEITKSKWRQRVGQQQVVLACGFDGAREVPTERIRRVPPSRIPHLVAASLHRSNVPPVAATEDRTAVLTQPYPQNQQMQTEIAVKKYFCGDENNRSN
jgi:hypothetical protein